MAKFGSCDLRELKRFQENLKKLQGVQKQEFIESCTKELAARLLARVIKRTDARKPENCPPGVTGGTLKRGWTVNNALRVQYYGGVYVIEIINPVEYASYVEYGHRTRNHKGWVKGKFMMTISENEIQRDAPKILEKKIMQKLGECFR